MEEYKIKKWHFAPIVINAPKPIMEAKQKRLKEDTPSTMELLKRLFENITDVEEENEAMDKYFHAKDYWRDKSTMELYRTLQKFHVVGGDNGLFKGDFIYFFYDCLDDSISYIKEYGSEPNKTRNHIRAILLAMDKLPIWGLLLQIIYLNGLLFWCNKVGNDIKEGEQGHEEITDIWQWLEKLAVDKELSFCFQPWGDEDIKRLQPLCNFLLDTELGQSVQRGIRQAHPQWFDDENNDFSDKNDIYSDKTANYSEKNEGNSDKNQNAGAKTTPKGRSPKAFAECFLREATKQADIKRVEALCKGKKGKELALIILVAIQEGIISKPTFKTLERHLGDIGNESGFNSYFGKGLKGYTSEEVEGIRKLTNHPLAASMTGSSLPTTL